MKKLLLLSMSFLIVLAINDVPNAFSGSVAPWIELLLLDESEASDIDKDGFTTEQGDCNDSDPSINPGATEICGDGIDQDCNGSDMPCPPDQNDVDNDGDGYTENQGDCNDGNASIYPGANETCGDGIDQDCDGSDMPCLTCADIAGFWWGGYTEYHCSGVTVIESFTMDVENDCSFTFHFFFGNVSGTWTISNNTISSTVDPGTGQCGLYTNIATVDGNRMDGTISSTGGSSGTFYFNKSN